MAVYIPTSLIPVNSLATTTTTAGSYSAPTGTTGIARTFQFNAAGTNAFTVSFGADAVATRIFIANPLTANVAAIYNGWWVTNVVNNASAIQMKVTTTSSPEVTGQVSGYTYS